MISLTLAATVGGIAAAAVGAATAVASGQTPDIPGLAVALSHIPLTAHGYAVVSAAQGALLGGAAGAGIGASVAAVAKAAANAALAKPL